MGRVTVYGPENPCELIMWILFQYLRVKIRRTLIFDFDLWITTITDDGFTIKRWSTTVIELLWMTALAVMALILTMLYQACTGEYRCIVNSSFLVSSFYRPKKVLYRFLSNVIIALSVKLVI